MRDEPAGIAASPAVLGLDDIAVELPVASVGSRVLAATVDYAVLTVIYLGAIVVFAFVAAGADGFGLTAGWLFALWMVVGFCLQWGYFAGLEILYKGQTLGKMAVRLRVVGRSGAMAGPVSILVRNLLRPIDVVFGVPIMAFDTLGRRLGDRFAGTLVLHLPPAHRALALSRVPERWSAREVAVAEAYLERVRGGMESSQALLLGRRLLRKLERDAPELLAEAGVTSDAAEPHLALGRALRAE